MSTPAGPLPSYFTGAERELIRREMGLHFGQYPRLSDGLVLRNWRGGPHAGEPKLPPSVRSMLERGLVEIRTVRSGPRAVFTGAGIAALRQPLKGRRAMDPARFVCLRRELGLDVPEDAAAGSRSGSTRDYFRRTRCGCAWGFAAVGAAALVRRPGATFQWCPSSVITVTDLRL